MRIIETGCVHQNESEILAGDLDSDSTDVARARLQAMSYPFVFPNCCTDELRPEMRIKTSFRLAPRTEDFPVPVGPINLQQ